jgi:hypothetical protein
LKEEKKELESALKEIEGGTGVGTAGSQVDVGKIKREIARIDMVIGDGTAPKPKASEQDQLVREEKELEDQIAEGMPTRDEMRHPARNPGAVRKHMEWGNRNQAKIQRYVAIQRILRPRDPKSIENLRKDK